jgi:hypothetical protein
MIGVLDFGFWILDFFITLLLQHWIRPSAQIDIIVRFPDALLS